MQINIYKCTIASDCEKSHVCERKGKVFHTIFFGVEKPPILQIYTHSLKYLQSNRMWHCESLCLFKIVACFCFWSYLRIKVCFTFGVVAHFYYIKYYIYFKFNFRAVECCCCALLGVRPRIYSFFNYLHTYYCFLATLISL